MHEMSPILVTGANGLLGRATIARLAPSSQIYALVRAPPQQAVPGAVKAVVHDLREPWLPHLPDVPDTIVHLAQSPLYRDFPEGARDVFELNVGATQRLLDWACHHKVKRFIYASSGSIYGHGGDVFHEDAPIEAVAALGHYVACKRCGELLTETYGGRMLVIVLRFFFAYGPGQRNSMLIPSLVDRITHGRPVDLQGDDGIRLNPIYVDDAAAAILAATRLEVSETINVAGPQVVTLREIALMVGDLTGCRPRFDIQSDVEPRHLVGGTRTMRRLLWAPKIEMAEGLRRMLAQVDKISP
jgi:nucleoside-diphosphate-sugar epimerase